MATSNPACNQGGLRKLCLKSLITGLLVAAGTWSLAQAPVITAVTPAKGNIGSNVTITGTGFGADVAHNIVTFGPLRAVVSVASATSVTAKVPAGATVGHISVLNTTTGLQVQSSAPFDVTFSGGAVNPCAFSNDLIEFGGTGSSFVPSSFVASDFNNDGKPDILMMSQFYPYVCIVKNNSVPGTLDTDSFADTLRYYIGGASASASAIGAGDLDGDGLPDVVVGNNSPAGITVFRNTSAGSTISFAPKLAVAGTAGPNVTIIDLDFDGKPEILIGGTVYRNTSTPGNLSFVAVTLINNGSYVAADMDADGKPDLVSLSGGTVYVSKNTGNAAPFTASFFATQFAVGPSPLIGLAVADIDGDGKPDILTMNNFIDKDSLYIYPNVTTAGTLNASSFGPRIGIGLNFPDPNVATANNAANQVLTGDVDGDGQPDIVVLDRTTNAYDNGYTVGVLANHTTPGSITAGSFSSASFELGTSVRGVQLADLDVDGRLDILATRNNSVSYVMTAMRNTMTENSCSLTVATAAPVISSFAPLAGDAGTSVVITGTNFNTTLSKMAVYFGGIRATVTGGSTTSLTVTVPKGVNYERIFVLDTQTKEQAMSNAWFAVTFGTTHTLTAASFDSTKNILIATNLSGAEPNYVSLGDFDQDGKYDIIHRYASHKNIHVTRNESTTSTFSFPVDGQFSTPTIYDDGLPIRDLNGDGMPEMIGSSYYALHLWKNNFTGGLMDSTSFGPRQTRIGGGLNDLVNPSEIGDLDGDGRPDLILSGTKGQFDQTGGFSIMQNVSANGSVAFTSKIIFPQTVGADVGLGDVDGDGKLDVILTDGVGSNLLIYQNNCSPGSISPATFTVITVPLTLPPSTYYYSIYVTDLDGDHKPDIILSHIKGITIIRNIHPGGALTPASFAAPFEITNAALPSGDPHLKLADLNGDGKPDLVTADVGEFLIYQNTATAGVLDASSFATPVSVGANAWTIDVADLNADGSPELIAYAGGNMSILYNGSALMANQPPAISTTTTTDLYAGAPTAIDPVISVTDPDNASLAGATVSITPGTLQASEDELVFSTQNGITGVYNSASGVLTLTGTSLVANYQTALRSVQYSNTSASPTTTARTITISVTDGSAASNLLTYTVNIQPGNNPPVISTTTTTDLYAGAPTAIDPVISVTDPDDASLAGATVSITPGTLQASEDELVFSTQNGITGVYNSASGVLTLTGTSLIANYQTALRSVQYSNTAASPTTTARTITISVTDGSAASNLLTYTVNIQPGNNPPVISTTTTTDLYAGAPTAIDPVISVSDSDDASLAGATVSITPGTLQASEDELVFSTQNGITGVYNSASGVLTLTGTSLVANYQTALRSVQYSNTATSPTTTARTITISVTDGSSSSNLLTYTVNIQAAQPGNDPPVITAETLNAVLNGTVSVDLTPFLSDPDGNLDLSTLAIVSQPQSGADAEITGGNTLIVDYSGTNFVGVDQLTIQVCDTQGLCAQQAILIDVTTVIVIYNCISANGDSQNSYFKIANINDLPDTQMNHVSIYNRWGDLVFEIDNYDNNSRVFTGVSDHGSDLPPGTYFYKIDFVSGKPSVTGYLSLKR